jgi:hypothetical protein
VAEVIKNVEIIIDDETFVMFHYVCPFCGEKQPGNHTYPKNICYGNPTPMNACCCYKCKKKFFGKVKIE